MKEVSIEKLLEILNTNIENINLTYEQFDEDLSLLDMDSITFIRVIVSIEDEFECEIPDSKLLMVEMNTMNKILEVLRSIQSDNII